MAVQKTNIKEVLTEVLPTFHPRFEDCESLLRRGEVFKEFMREYQRMNKLEGDEKFGVVCHSMFIATLTAEGLDESDKMGFKNYVWCQNCQLLPFNKY